MRRALLAAGCALGVAIATTGALPAVSAHDATYRDGQPVAHGTPIAHGARAAIHPESPPPAHTGGFGEPTCQECHFQNDVNAGPGRLSLAGLDVSATPGSTHRLTVRLSHPDMLRAGFMLSARTSDGRQAGTLRPLDARSTITDAGSVAYAHHTMAGTEAHDATAEWTLDWQADGVPANDSVVFHVVGNAGNDDASPFGDYVYATSVTVHIEQ